MVWLLVEHNADIEAANSFGWRPLHLAVYNGFLDIFHLLLNHGAEVQGANQNKWTPLISAARGAHRDSCRHLLEKGANAMAQTRWGDTALHQAAIQGRLDITRVLLDHGAIPDMGNYVAFSAFHLSIRSCNVEFAALFVEHGVSTTSRNNYGKTALDWLPVHEPDRFFDRILSFKDVHPIGLSDQRMPTIQSIHRLTVELDEPDYDQEALLSAVQSCLVQLDDLALATSCALQLGAYDAEDSRFSFSGSCNFCGDDYYYYYYYCSYTHLSAL